MPKLPIPWSTSRTNGYYITFKIEEGERFKVGTIDMDGDLILPKASLMPGLQIAKEPFFNRETVRTGYPLADRSIRRFRLCYADISPLTAGKSENLLVDITYTAQTRQGLL
jgi:outer membrane protein insertion porin family